MNKQKLIFIVLLIQILFINLTIQGAQTHEKVDPKDHRPLTEKKNKEPLSVHVIPHSHDDLGWLNTMDQYFYGSYDIGSHASVESTISSYVEALYKDRKKTFVQVETGFFKMWWIRQPQEIKDKVNHIISTGQLEFINGGWCQNDEAGTYYDNIIENMWIGHRFLKNEVNVVPNVGWSIDPFGHSSTQAQLYSQMGFNGWWFARIDYQDKQKRLEQRAMEMIWTAKQANYKKNPIFTAVNYQHYSAPDNFCFDAFCGDVKAINDDPYSLGYNIEERAQELVDYFKDMSQHYETNELLHTFGDDFQYTNAEMYYRNLDLLINYINKNSEEKFDNFTIKYSTPGDYLTTLNKKKEVSFPSQSYDFFPYADNSHSYWTGYFTSRIAGKGQIRELGKYMINCRTYLGLLRYYNQSDFCQSNEQFVEQSLYITEQALGVNQHHDAVTGTERQKVANNYMYLMHNATETLRSVMSDVVKEQIYNHTNIKINDTMRTYNWNSTAVEQEVVYEYLSNKKNVIMAVHNPMKSRSVIMKVRVPNQNIEVFDLASNKTLYAEMVCSQQERDSNNDNCVLFFNTTLKGYSLNEYFLISKENTSFTKKLDRIVISEGKQNQTVQISDQKELTIQQDSDLLKYKYCNQDKTRCQTEQFTLNYRKYFSYQGSGQKSGAYIFRPQNTNGSEPYNEFKEKAYFNGKLVSVIELQGDKAITNLIFQNLDELHDHSIEIETYLKSIDIQDKKGKEIVISIQSKDIKNDNTFFTDSNGLDMLERKINYRPTWNLTVTQPISGNYYPVNAMIQIKDKKKGKIMTLLNDRAQGGSSLQEGQMELMINRRCLEQDSRGVGEALNETNRYNDQGLEQLMRHWLVFEKKDGKTQEIPRQIQFEFDHSYVQYFSGLDQIPKNIKLNAPKKMPLVDKIRPMVKFQMRYYGFGSRKYLMRVGNMNQIQTTVFGGVFDDILETTLTANQDLETWKKNQMVWKEHKYDLSFKQVKETKSQKIFKRALSNIKRFICKKNKNQRKEKSPVVFNLELTPLEIRTFNITSGAI